MKKEIKKIKMRCEAKESNDTAKLYIYGTIAEDSWWSDDVVSSKAVLSELEKITSKKLDVHINSGGGDVFESISISNILKNFDGIVNVYIDGLAASGASVIAMAGQAIFMPKNAMIMVHKAWTYTAGNSDELMKASENLAKIDSAVLESYTGKFVGTQEELAELISVESWLTAEECLTLGFCTKIIEDKNTEESNATISKDSLLAKYKNKSLLDNFKEDK